MTDIQDALEHLDEWVAEGVVRGAGAAVWLDGDVVASNYVGLASESVPVGEDTLFALASVSKPITAAAIMQGVQSGDLALDAPVSLYAPEASEAADPLDPDLLPPVEALRDRITLRNLLSHTSGFPENVGVKRVRMRDQPTLDAIVDAMCGVPLQSAPGEVLRYSNVGIAVGGRALEETTGDSVHTAIRTKILEPLDLSSIELTPGTNVADRIAWVDDAAAAGTPVESYNSEYWRRLGITWGGYYATPRDIAQFAASFFPGMDSPLSDEVRAEMIVDQTGGVPGGVGSAGIHWNRGAWGLGWEVAADKRNHWTGSKRSPRTFCHWGQSGTLVWADPDRSLVLAVFANRAVHTPWPLRPARWAALSDDLIEAVDSRRPR